MDKVKINMLTTQQAAQLRKCSRYWIWALIKNGRLPAVKVGRDWMIEPDALKKCPRNPVGNPNFGAPKMKGTR